jgi:hypothetical protein
MPESTIEAAVGGSEHSPISALAVEGEGNLSVAEAARSLAQARKPNEQQQAAE